MPRRCGGSPPDGRCPSGLPALAGRQEPTCKGRKSALPTGWGQRLMSRPGSIFPAKTGPEKSPPLPLTTPYALPKNYIYRLLFPCVTAHLYRRTDPTSTSAFCSGGGVQGGNAPAKARPSAAASGAAPDGIMAERQRGADALHLLPVGGAAVIPSGRKQSRERVEIFCALCKKYYPALTAQRGAAPRNRGEFEGGTPSLNPKGSLWDLEESVFFKKVGQAFIL